MILSDIDLIDQLAIHEARASFWAYRQFVNPKFIVGWWQREMAGELQQFYVDLGAGLRPKLVIEAPPQHGKSKMIVDFITWVSGKNPNCKTIYTSFSERLGVRANLTCQRIYDSPTFHRVFPETRINRSENDAHTMTRNREMLEYAGHEGYFRNTTVRGSITGESLTLGVIDDPIKGREEAGSANVRDKTWEWLTDDFFSRFSEDAGLLAILTRWHIDDPIGRLRAQLGDALKVVSYPALAMHHEAHREIGDPLFPELKSREFLLERKSLMAAVNWEALYQQNPQIVGGEIIHGEHFTRYAMAPIIKHRVIYADTAQKTKERHDYSVLQCWGMGADARIYLLDMIRGKWEAPELERRTIAFWQKHKSSDPTLFGQLRSMKIEDKASGTGLIQSIKTKGGIPVYAIQRNVDKYTRVLDVLGYIESGYVCIPEAASYTNDFIEECESFTSDDSHQFDDQVDVMTDAINDMLAGVKVVSSAPTGIAVGSGWYAEGLS